MVELGRVVLDDEKKIFYRMVKVRIYVNLIIIYWILGNLKIKRYSFRVYGGIVRW